MYEIEIKAHLQYPDEARMIVASFATFVKEYEKHDTYYDRDGITFRLRTQKNDGLTRNIATYKIKQKDGGLEKNREIEFDVDDKDAFHEFALGIGFPELIRKEKIGFLYTYKEASIEITQITGLGWFIEIEKMVELENEIPAAEQLIFSILDKSGIGQEKIEPEYYIDLLAFNKTTSHE